MIDVQYASLTSQGVQHRVFYLDGHPSRYQPRPTGLNFGEQTGTGVFPLVIPVPSSVLFLSQPREQSDTIGHGLWRMTLDDKQFPYTTIQAADSGNQLK